MIFCQSCGMPMTTPEHFGAETDGSPSSETIKRKGKALEIGSEHNSMQRSEIINPCSRRTTRTAAGRF
ncbi:zinc ribbon domain-containing protein [Alistipes senegalensis]|uniref:Zinc ribbon domain-containing protein n=2 Tax=Alistipes senegalensis TaxID=1288121 RepID=A0ABY5VAY4_9BACT|nr:zinc ribbon domain-containing protein [Alistipes senegalensis]UEA88826.1 zinc ribbon domain-containing protein [Alistipes senegalensis]UWN66755.1 zinc ribbon domain-containing protein [Alistipes senegalensis JC50]